MAKILFINIPAYGHVNPTLALVKELVNRGNKVVYYIGEAFMDVVEKMGAEVRSSGMPLFDGSATGEVMLNYLRQNYVFLEELINGKEHFDCLIYDSAYFFGKEVGRVLNIKAISSQTTFAQDREMVKEVIKDQEERMYSIFAQMKESYEAQVLLKKYRELLNIDLTEAIYLITEKADLNIVYTSRLFQPNEENFIESFRFVGPSVTERREDLDFELNSVGKKKLVYISLGTIYNRSLDFYIKCLEAFKDMDCEFVMSVGKNTDIQALGKIPDNFSVHNFVPQLEILRKANAFITHGGMNSTSEGLYFGLPLLVIPQSVDQPIVARQVEKLGAGIMLDKDSITPSKLRHSLEKILNDESYKQNAMLIRESFINAGGYEKAADEIVSLLEQGNKNLVTC
ncbi:MAG TPA: macrolide family glycosyltransferase [Ruminiclostridium sp.]|nr:macrolide family glycosyltransferase [Ruminiclostridium sp.]